MRYWDGELYCRGTSVKSNCAFWVLGEIKLFIKKLYLSRFMKNKMLSLVMYTTINPSPLMHEDVEESTHI